MRADMNLDDTMPYGYVTYTGQRMTNPLVDLYNGYQRQIDQRKREGFPVPEWLFNARHKALVLGATA
ncbi:hypothetical protein LCGC14_0188030 [marine sediment metagenome]|uniref:Uncharacterized protein n=1 Tax=marine sediment metagenome TaxID=412755 RepID=A0A0F9UMZ8_9ZZZZ